MKNINIRTRSVGHVFPKGFTVVHTLWINKWVVKHVPTVYICRYLDIVSFRVKHVFVLNKYETRFCFLNPSNSLSLLYVMVPISPIHHHRFVWNLLSYSQFVMNMIDRTTLSMNRFDHEKQNKKCYPSHHGSTKKQNKKKEWMKPGTLYFFSFICLFIHSYMLHIFVKSCCVSDLVVWLTFDWNVSKWSWSRTNNKYFTKNICQKYIDVTVTYLNTFV